MANSGARACRCHRMRDDVVHAAGPTDTLGDAGAKPETDRGNLCNREHG